MANPGRKHRLIVIALAAGVFILHALGWLTPLVLLIAGGAGTLAALGLWADAGHGPRFLQDLLGSDERKVDDR